MKHISNIKRFVIVLVVKTVLWVLYQACSCDSLKAVVANDMRGTEFVLMMAMSMASMLVLTYFSTLKDEKAVVNVDSQY